MSAKVQWVDCKALDAAILDTNEAGCSEYQVFALYTSPYFFYTRKIPKFIIGLVTGCMQVSNLARTIGFRNILAYPVLLEKFYSE